MIKRVEMPIVPIGIAGAYDAWPRCRAYPMPAPLVFPAGKGTIAASIGPPIYSRQLTKLPRERVLEDLFKELERLWLRAGHLRRKP